MKNRETAVATVQREMVQTQAFLRRLAKHLEENGMPGQAGNCTLRADAMNLAITSFDWLEAKR